MVLVWCGPRIFRVAQTELFCTFPAFVGRCFDVHFLHLEFKACWNGAIAKKFNHFGSTIENVNIVVHEHGFMTSIIGKGLHRAQKP